MLIILLAPCRPKKHLNNTTTQWQNLEMQFSCSTVQDAVWSHFSHALLLGATKPRLLPAFKMKALGSCLLTPSFRLMVSVSVSVAKMANDVVNNTSCTCSPSEDYLF